MTRIPPRSVLFASAALVLEPTAAHALGIRLADQSPFATARGAAFAATADDPSAIYFNPAGITQLTGHHVQFGLYGITLNSTVRPAAAAGGGGRFETEDKHHLLPQFFYTYTCENAPFSLGLGVYSPFGLSLEWPENTGFRTLAIEGQVTYATVNPVVAWQVSPKFSIAAGPMVNMSEGRLRQGIAFPGDEVKFRGRDTSLGFNAGLLWKPSEPISLGASYRSGNTMEWSGRSDVWNPFLPPGLFFPSGSERGVAEFEFPQSVVLGVSYRPTPKWNLEFNWDWTDWDTLDTVTVRRGGGALSQAFNWQSSAWYSFGGTHYFDNGMRLSAGYIFSENSVADPTFNPLVPDSDRHVFSAGLGGRHGQLTWDLAYQLAYGPDRTVSGSQPSAVLESADGTYRFISHAITLAVGYSF